MHLDLDMMGQRGQRWGFTLIKVGPGSPGAGGGGGGLSRRANGQIRFYGSPPRGGAQAVCFKFFLRRKQATRVVPSVCFCVRCSLCRAYGEVILSSVEFECRVSSVEGS